MSQTPTMTPTSISRSDILPMDQYRAIRKEKKAANAALKKNRRIEVGPFATFYFENFDTMWMQIHEMLHIEGGGDAQIDDEISAYNPLVPNGRELVATMMIEIVDPVRRARELAQLGNIEDLISIEVGGFSIPAAPETEVERTNEDGKTSSVHFLHFPFSDEQVEKFCGNHDEAIIRIGHRNYGHMAVIQGDVRSALAKDFV